MSSAWLSRHATAILPSATPTTVAHRDTSNAAWLSPPLITPGFPAEILIIPSASSGHSVLACPLLFRQCSTYRAVNA
jgi:hypothetical protein